MIHGYRRRIAALLLGLSLPAAALAQPALPGGFIADLNSLQARLGEGDGGAVKERARAQAERLEGGNDADRWARALYLQLAARAAVDEGSSEAAAEHLAAARGTDAAPAEWRSRRLLEEVRLRQAAGQIETAAALLRDWLEVQGGESTQWWRMARLEAELARWSEAARWVERAQASGSPTPSQRALAAAIYQRAGQDERALALLGEGLDADSSAANWRRAAGLAQRLGVPGKAAAIWQAGWRLGVLKGESDLLILVKLHLAGGTPARAAEHLAMALEEGALPDTLEHRRLLARAWEQARDHDRALAAWRVVAERSAAAADWRRLGQLAHGWGRDELAQRALARAAAQGDATAQRWLAALES